MLLQTIVSFFVYTLSHNDITLFMLVQKVLKEYPKCTVDKDNIYSFLNKT